MSNTTIAKMLVSVAKKFWDNVVFWPVIGWISLQNGLIWWSAWLARGKAIRDNESYRIMEEACKQSGRVECLHAVPHDRDPWHEFFRHAKSGYQDSISDLLRTIPVYWMLAFLVILLILYFFANTMYRAWISPLLPSAPSSTDTENRRQHPGLVEGTHYGGSVVLYGYQADQLANLFQQHQSSRTAAPSSEFNSGDYRSSSVNLLPITDQHPSVIDPTKSNVDSLSRKRLSNKSDTGEELP